MAAVGLGLQELLILIALGGFPGNDAASLIDPAGYLKAHGVELKADGLVELVAREAKGGKEQMTQLLAIRWLGAHPDEAKKAAGALDALRSVADGKKGQDAHGFARDHAARALARIEGKPATAARPIPAGSVRADALSWFPAEATLFGAADLRSAGGPPSLDPDAVSTLLGRLVPEEGWKPIYGFVDAVGNLRLDRVAIAVEINEKAHDKSRIWVRLTGAGDPKGLVDFLAPMYPEREERKGPGGEPIVIRTKKGSAPAFVFVGKTDFVIAGYEADKGNHIEVVDALLDVRAGKGKSVVNGPFAKVLEEVREKSQGLFVADVPESFRTEGLRGLDISSFKAIPRRLVVEMTGGKTLTVRAQGTMKDEEEAAATAKALEQLKAQGLQALKNRPRDVPADLAEVGRKTLEGAKIDAGGATVTASVQVPAEALKAALKAVEEMLQALARPAKK
jgi:hypothetical protein